ncbi:hypothetical protein CEXT_236271 [Caerostris extrusa]|uniref:Uncharacterized protein n=1 Tax=Caerostris extrusa TaxID=172846 RepID=A0AAV4UZI9_CAEEX|nr:hypothetical protein CEXT_236271 [Caerostris extrusa]
MFDAGITQLKFPLADEPVKGPWKITVSSGKETQSTTFDVKEYRLPTFGSIDQLSFICATQCKNDSSISFALNTLMENRS